MAVILPSVPWEPSPYMTGYWFHPTGVVEHRTIGRYFGDKSVLSRGLVPSVQFLIGQDEGQWCQLQYADMVCYGAAGANQKKVHIELSGQNGEPLTPWQIRCLGIIHKELADAFGWPFPAPDGLYDGERLWVDRDDRVLHLNHRNVDYPPNRSYNHYDYIEQAEYQAAVGGSNGGGTVEDLVEDDMRLFRNTDNDEWFLFTSIGWERNVDKARVWNMATEGKVPVGALSGGDIFALAVSIVNQRKDLAKALAEAGIAEEQDVAAPVPVDVNALAAAIAAALPDGRLTAAKIKEIAKAVNDDAAARLAG